MLHLMIPRYILITSMTHHLVNRKACTYSNHILFHDDMATENKATQKDLNENFF